MKNIVVIGAGTGGMSVASQLRKKLPNVAITIVDGAKLHFYQPGFTKLGGGVYNSSKYLVYNVSDLAKNFNLVRESVQEIDPINKKLKFEKGELNYDKLIISAGIETCFNLTEGLEELLQDKNSNVVSVYKYEYALKTKEKREKFTGGKALFTQPVAPIKCAGAPQKLLYLCSEYWNSKGIENDSHFYTPLGQMFGVKYYSDGLKEIVDKRGLKPHFNTTLEKVLSGNKALFKCGDTLFEENFDFLHAVPKMKGYSFLKNVSDKSGFVDVNDAMKHKIYEDIYALGDCVNLPNAKTAAAVFSQAPVLVANLLADLKNEKTYYRYEGYSACPIFLGGNKLMLAEFSHAYKDGEVVCNITPTFYKDNKGNKSFYHLTKLLGLIYPLHAKGNWYGNSAIFNRVSTKKRI